MTNIGASTGLLRQYFPKSSDLAVWTPEHIQRVAAELNARPRKCLNNLTPHQAMRRSTGHKFTEPVRDDH